MRYATWVALVLLLSTATLPAQSLPEAAAESAELQWLGWIDAGNYQSGWQHAADALRNAGPESNFDEAMRNSRAPLGVLRSRTLKNAKPTRTLPGAPDGHYMVTQFDSVFSKKSAAVETVIAEQDPNGSWRVAGYFIR